MTYIVENGKVIRVSIYDELEKRYLLGIEGVSGRAIDRSNFDEYLFNETDHLIVKTSVRGGREVDKNYTFGKLDSPEVRYKKDFKESYGRKILENGWRKEFRTPPNDNNGPPIGVEGLLYLMWKEYNNTLGTVYLPSVGGI